MRSSLLFLVACGPAASDVAPAPGVVVPDVPLDEQVTIEGLMGHLDALQAVADAHDGIRAGETAGYAASAEYAEQVLTDAGYAVERVPFTWLGWEQVGPSVLETTDGALTYEDGEDLAALWFSASGDVTAPLAAVDLVLPPTASSSSTSGCDEEDFVGFPAGSVALIQRGLCTFATKARNAEAAGAVAVIAFNEGQVGRQAVEQWVLTDEDVPTIPVLGASFAVGEALAAALDSGPVEVHLAIDATTFTYEAFDLIADTQAGDPDRTVVIGAHLDSVYDGPGINDNGSGTALVLELARLFAEAELQPANRVRFALWGAEELGLIGSQRYLDGLDETAVSGILANLNYDMIASPNGVRFVYDGDGSAFGIAGPPGSDVIEEIQTEWFEGQGLAWEETPFDGRSDYFGFILRGIPAGGLFSGAEVGKTLAEANTYGGEAGLAHDPCYHQACDTTDNLDPTLFLELARAGAHATARLADYMDPLGSRAGARAAWNQLPAPIEGIESCHGDRPSDR